MTWRKRLGIYLMVRRDHEKVWNRTIAAKQARLDWKTVTKIERGANVEVVSLERYAKALGRDLEDSLRTALALVESWDGRTERRSGLDRRSA